MTKSEAVGSQCDAKAPGESGWSISIRRNAAASSEDLPRKEEVDRVNEPGRGCKASEALQRSGAQLSPFRRGRQFLRLLAVRSASGSAALFEPRTALSPNEFPQCDTVDPDDEPAGRARLLGRQEIGRGGSVPLEDNHDSAQAARRPLGRLRDWSSRHIVNRQVFIRTDGRVRFFTVTQRAQYACLAGAGVMALAFLSTAAAVFVQEQRVANRDAEILQQQTAYNDLLGEVGEYNRAFSRIAQNLEDNQASLLALLEEDIGGVGAAGGNGAAGSTEALSSASQERSLAMEAKVQAIREALAEARQGRARLDSARAELGERLTLTENRLAESDRRVKGLEQQLASRESELTRLTTDYEAKALSLQHAESRVASLEENLAVASRHEAQLTATIESKDKNLAEAHDLQIALQSDFAKRFEMLQADYLSRTAALQGEVTQLRTHSAQLEQHLDELSSKHLLAVNRIEGDAEQAVTTIEKTVAMTGLDLASLVPEERAEEEESARGGPFVMEDETIAPDSSNQLEVALSLLDLKVERWRELQDLLRAMPLAPPLENFVVTSSFGSRVDPINGRKAVHQGIDFRGRVGTSVYSTAPGRVIYAGRRGEFGNFIEIDHGYGIHSRYAHLNQILVKVGETVTNRQKIGNLGTTGRSTGPHVHYEIVFNGVHQDPAKFLTAGKYVFKD